MIFEEIAVLLEILVAEACANLQKENKNIGSMHV